MNKADVLLGLQWGDEGKGKIVDFLTPDYDNVARFQGGPNAGHSLEFNNVKQVMHTIPSGIFHPDKLNIIGNGVVIDPVQFREEAGEAEDLGADVKKQIVISDKATLILPTHRLLDAAYEKSKGNKKIGSTLKGIGPAYTDKVARCAIRIGDIFSKNFKENYAGVIEHHKKLLNAYEGDEYTKDLENEWFEALEYLKDFKVQNTEYLSNSLLDKGKSFLAEGAQGTLLDKDYGTYPFVTSSNTTSSAVSTGLGLSPKRIGNVIGVFKAYCTRVGSGPFPTELFDDDGQKLRDNGHEYGSTTGRPRRCGWLDMVALKYSIMINGVTELIMTKSDVLDDFDEIKVTTSYKTTDGEDAKIPYCLNDIKAPVFKTLKGWKKSITGIQEKSDMPKELLDYISFIEKETGVPVTIISFGPKRKQTLRIK